MAKVLQFISESTLYEAEPVKIERKKIYGYKELSALPFPMYSLRSVASEP